jgi:hypothetical protein
MLVLFECIKCRKQNIKNHIQEKLRIANANILFWHTYRLR